METAPNKLRKIPVQPFILMMTHTSQLHALINS